MSMSKLDGLILMDGKMAPWRRAKAN